MARTITVTTTAWHLTLTGPEGTFSPDNRWRQVSGPGIPALAHITSVLSSTTATMSVVATATVTTTLSLTDVDRAARTRAMWSALG